MTTTHTKALPRTSPCYDRAAVEGTHSLRQLNLKGKLNIRGNPGDPGFVSGIRLALDMDLPVSANTLNQHESMSLFWLGPDEWLLHCDLEQTTQLESRIRQSLKVSHFAVTEVSDYYTVLRLSGPDAEALLRRGTPLDLHIDAFGCDQIAQTRFGHATVLLHRLGDAESWDIQVRWTYAQYVWDYLVSAMEGL
ncbi:MAG: sarcosine oxidase subunit gamma [bacterium]